MELRAARSGADRIPLSQHAAALHRVADVLQVSAARGFRLQPPHGPPHRRTGFIPKQQKKGNTLWLCVWGRHFGFFRKMWYGMCGNEICVADVIKVSFCVSRRKKL